MPDPPHGGIAPSISPVDAHSLLNSASAVVLGVGTLERWESLSDAQRREVLARVRRHAEELAVRLRELIQPEAL